LERIGVGVVGFGGRGRFFCRVFGEHPGSRLVAIAELGEERRAEAHQRYPEANVFATLDEMLASEGIDAVVVASSDHAHYDNALQALKHRKHVLLEKPMAQTVEQCDGLVRAWHSHAKDRVFMVGLELRHCTLFTRMRELLDEGVIGHVVMGQAIDNVSVGDKYFYHNMYSRKSFVRSLLLQKGVHTIDLVNWFMDSRPSKVYAVGGLNVYGGQAPEDKRCSTCDEADSCPHVLRDAQEKGVQDFCVFSRACDVEDNSQVIIEYDNNTRAVYTECHFTPEYTREFTLVGDKGKMTAFFDNPGNFWIRVAKRFTNEVEEHRPKAGRGGHGGGDTGLIEEFVDCVKTGRQPLHSIVVARDSTAIAAAAAESIESRMPVQIPPCSL
jgi:predicted dehydrogenase